MSNKTEIVFLRASDREVFFDDFLVSEFFNSHVLYHSLSEGRKKHKTKSLLQSWPL
jgi:hypothetical protein